MRPSRICETASRLYEVAMARRYATNRRRPESHNPRTEIRAGCWSGPSSAQPSRDAATILRAKPCAGRSPGPADCARANSRSNLDRTSRCTTRGRCRKYRKAQKRWRRSAQPAPGRTASVSHSREASGVVRHPRESFSVRGRRVLRAPIRPLSANGGYGQSARAATCSIGTPPTRRRRQPAAEDG